MDVRLSWTSIFALLKCKIRNVRKVLLIITGGILALGAAAFLFSRYFSKEEINWLLAKARGEPKSYPNTTLEGRRIGELDQTQLEALFQEVEAETYRRDFVLNAEGGYWCGAETYNIGLSFSRSATLAQIAQFNALGFWEAVKLAFQERGDSIPVKLVYALDQNRCQERLGQMRIPFVLTPDRPLFCDSGIGSPIDPGQTCRAIEAALQQGEFSANVVK